MSDTTPNPTPRRLRSFVSDAEWEALLEIVRTQGEESARAALAQGRPPTAEGKPARYTTLRDMLKDPRRAAEWEDAKAVHLRKFVTFLQDSALKPDTIREYDKKTGVLIRERTDRRNANWACLMVLRRLSPEWRERKAVSIDGQIQHDHQHTLGESAMTYRITADDVMKLPSDEATQLFRLLESIEQNRLAEKENPRVVINQSIKQPARLPGPEEEGRSAIDP